jgi:hypothetical protein
MPKIKKSAPKAKKKKIMANEMKKFAAGGLHSGSADGPVVKNPAQAKAIGMNVSGQSKPKAPPKKKKSNAKK